jgi:hypothetical protein
MLLLSFFVLSGVAAAEDAVVTSSNATVSTTAPREESGQAWSVLGPKTLAPGDNALEASAGYPAISGSYLRGVASGINAGVRLSFVYGVEGMFRESAPGFKAQGLLKVRFLDSGRVSLGMTFEPGLLYHSSFLQGARVGLTLPVGFRLGIAASSAIAIAVLVDFPMWVEFGTFGGFNLPILTGGGVEYFLTSQLAVFARARIGPTIRTARPAEVTFDAAVGVGYRF